MAAAEKLDRKSIGYEIFKDYEGLIRKRFEGIKDEQLELLPIETESVENNIEFENNGILDEIKPIQQSFISNDKV